MIETMEWKHNKLVLLDQTKLPASIETIDCHDYQRVGLAIKKLEVRGAPAIGAAAAFAMVLGFQSLIKTETVQTIWQKFAQIKCELIATRPTAINLAWAAEKVYQQAIALSKNYALTEISQQLEGLACDIFEKDIITNHKIGNFGAELLGPDSVVLTHCNAGALATCGWGTALGVIRQAHQEGKIKMVYADETRPLLQGSRLTSWELQQDGIPVTLISDNMAAWTMKTKGVGAVVVGADRITANGDTANKIGTYGVAILARQHGIPFYIAAPTSTFDFSIDNGMSIPIEERSAQEVREACGQQTAPLQIPTFNPAFDVTPAEFITGIITEYGVITAPYSVNILKLKKEVLKEEQI